MATDGGVTFGGGEPGLYARFIHEFARKYGGRWSINMETSLNYPRKNLLLLRDAVDYYFIIDSILYDLRHEMLEWGQL